jgi:hypothetical protein
MTSRDSALQIASDHLRQHGLRAEIHSVFAWDEIAFKKPVLYLARPVRLQDYWIVYLARPRG